MTLRLRRIDPDTDDIPALLAAAETVAQTHGAPRRRLEIRVELTGNHHRFAARGFACSGGWSHPGYDRITTIEMVKPLRLDPTPD